jgi:hypothetical protein
MNCAILSSSPAREFLVSENLPRGSGGRVGIAGGCSRTLVLLDATGSMGDVLSKVKVRVVEMLEGIQKAIADFKVKTKDAKVMEVELQFAAYRKYNAPSKSSSSTPT